MQYRGGMKASKDEFKDRVTIKHIQMGDVRYPMEPVCALIGIDSHCLVGQFEGCACG